MSPSMATRWMMIVIASMAVASVFTHRAIWFQVVADAGDLLGAFALDGDGPHDPGARPGHGLPVGVLCWRHAGADNGGCGSQSSEHLHRGAARTPLAWPRAHQGRGNRRFEGDVQRPLASPERRCYRRFLVLPVVSISDHLDYAAGRSEPARGRLAMKSATSASIQPDRPGADADRLRKPRFGHQRVDGRARQRRHRR